MPLNSGKFGIQFKDFFFLIGTYMYRHLYMQIHVCTCSIKQALKERHTYISISAKLPYKKKSERRLHVFKDTKLLHKICHYLLVDLKLFCMIKYNFLDFYQKFLELTLNPNLVNTVRMIQIVYTSYMYFEEEKIQDTRAFMLYICTIFNLL